jgi:hypothetical protein
MTSEASGTKLSTSMKFYTFLLATYAVLLLIRMPDILIKRRFWAEEGEVYFHNAWNERWYDALFAVHSGYLNLSASIATLLAAHLVPLEFAPLVSTTFALFIQLCPVFLLITGCVEWLRNRVTLTLALLLLLACNNTGEVWLNSITSQFHLALCAALILALPAAGGWLGAFRAGLLVLAPLSGPASIFLTPLFFLRAWLDRSRARLIQGGLLAAFGVLQVLMVALHPDPGRSVGIGPRLLILVMYIKHLIEPLFGRNYAARVASRLIETVTSGGPVLPEITITLIAILAIVITAWKTADPVVNWLLAGGATIMALSYFGSLAPHIGLLVVGGGGRYEYAPGVLFGLTLLGISKRSEGWVKAISTVLVIWVIVVGMHDYFRDNRFFGTGSTWTKEISRWRADPSYRVQFWPVGGGSWRSQLGDPHLHDGGD